MTRHPMNRARKPNTRESERLFREAYITSTFPSLCTNATRWKCSGICCAGDDCTARLSCLCITRCSSWKEYVPYLIRGSSTGSSKHPSLYLDCRQWIEKGER